MSTTLSSVFSRSNISDECKLNDDVNLYEIISPTLTNGSPILTAAFNNCYQKALLSLIEQVDDIDSQASSSAKYSLSSYNIVEDDFDVSVLPNRSSAPNLTTLCQWRHEQFSTEKFHSTIIPIVVELMRSKVLNWIELELKNEEDRKRQNEKYTDDLKNKISELKSTKKSINIDRLYELSGDSADILIEQIDWKYVATKLRSNGGFKYCDEYSLKRIWKQRSQYGVKASWSDDEDKILIESVERLGYGKWMEISKQELLEKNKKSPFMCAQRYMSKINKQYAKRRFTQIEKDLLVSIYNHRRSNLKDYRFCTAHAAYTLGDRCIPEITHVWTSLNPDIQKASFKPEEDAIILDHVNRNPSLCWATLAMNHLPDRSATQCRQRYRQLVKAQSGETKRPNRNSNVSRLSNYSKWLQEQSTHTRTLLEQLYPKSCLTHLQKSIVEMHTNKIELLMEKLYNNQIPIKKCLPLRQLILKLNTPTVTIDEIYSKFVDHT